MKILLFKEKKEKYYDEYIKENNEILFNLNKYIAIICIGLNIIVSIFIDPVYFSNILIQVFMIKIPVFIFSFVLLIFSFFKYLKKFNTIASYPLVLSLMIFSINFMLLVKNEPMLVTIWIMLIIFVAGIYPIKISHSIIIVLLSFGYFAFNYLQYGHFNDRYMQHVIVDTAVSLIISTIFKIIFKTTRQREFYAKKNLEYANKEIAELNEKLKSFDKLKTDFFSNISHEIRTPLTLILSPVESYLDGKIKVDDMNIFMTDLKNNSMKLQYLINDLLDFSKLDAGKMKLNIRETDIVLFIKNYVHSFQTSAEIKNLSLKYYDESTYSKVYIDQNKIDKVIMNILSNAIKFTDKGFITVSLRNTSRIFIIEISDSGPGIPENMKNEIFERFKQIDSGLSRNYNGTGIGLALAKEYMEMHKGKIIVESKFYKEYPDDHGTTFRLEFLLGTEHYLNMNNAEILTENEANELKTLPIINKIPSKTGTELTKNDNAKPSILIVEDNIEMAEFIRQLLKDYNIVIAENGKKALENLNCASYDLVISDIMMPEMDGYTLLKKIKENKSLCKIPIIMLTAKTDDITKIETLEDGANDYLIKPFNARELLARVKTQIDLKLLLNGMENKSSVYKNVTDDTRKKIDRILSFLEKNYMDLITRDDLAKTLKMSPDHFGRMFKKITGKKITDYINDLRIKQAVELLNKSDKKIIDIAMETGFESLRTFNREFAKIMKTSPSEYKTRRN